MQRGNAATIAIERIAFGGSGIGFLDGRVAFVPGTVDGDVVEIEITEVRKRYVRGRITKILKQSDHRTSPLCGSYGRCGGCCYQHMAYDRQLFWKERQVLDTFQHIGGIPSPPVLAVIPSPKPYHYRWKAGLHIGREYGRPKLIGFMSGASNRIVAITRCEIVEESINHLLQECRHALHEGTWSPVEERITLWSQDETSPSWTPLGPSAAAPFILRTIKERRVTVPRDGFFQANPNLICKMIDLVLAASAPRGGETVVDGFCGSGLFSLFLAPQSNRVHGIEWDVRAVEAARHNVAQLGFHNISLHHGDIGSVLQQFADPVDVLVIDPPRAGCGKALLERISTLSPGKIVYVSCNPATQARDIRHLCGKGYRLQSLQPLDMFPQTAHIEVIATLLHSRYP